MAFISDIHGDFIALQAALSRIALYAPDTIVCLGDVAQGGAQPRETVEALRKLDCPVLMGNADHWMITGEVGDDSTEAAPSAEQQEVRLWSLEQLGDENIAYLSDRPFSLEIPLEDGATVCCVHATLRSFNEVILPETPAEEVEAAFKETRASVVTGGHTHRQWVRRWNDRLFFNPGSVGLAYDLHVFDGGANPTEFIDPWAEFAVLTAGHEGLALDFGKGPVDPNEVKDAFARVVADLTPKRPRPPIGPPDVKDYYEKRAREYDATSWDHPAMSSEERAEQEELLSALASLPPATTLEVACGTGYLSRYLPGDLIATDYSDSMLREARRKDPAMKVVRADALHLPFRDRSCERVVAANFYGHLEPPHASAFLREARRVADQVVIVDAAPGLRVSDSDFEERILADGSRHLIYKRFFRADDLLYELGGGTVLFAGRIFVAVAA